VHTTPPTIPSDAPASLQPRRTAADVKADRTSPEGRGLDTGEDRRTLTTAGPTPKTAAVTCIMPMSARESALHVRSDLSPH
jgi:hypothetical protein